MRFLGKVVGISRDIETNQYHITFSADNIAGYDEIKSIDKLTVEAKRYRKKRSLDANAYSWALINKIARVNNTSDDEVYEQMLARYGQVEIDDNGAAVIISLLDSIDVSKIGLHLKYIGSGTVEEKKFNHYKVLRGQSTYNTKEMSLFIEGIVSEAKELGIETLTPAELERMKLSWKA